jgi:hypothetical protein
VTNARGYDKRGPLVVNSAKSKWLYCAGIGAVALVLVINIVTIGRQAPWEDEIFAVSTGWSLAHSQPPILSVLARYPQTGPPILFYGPVSFEAEASLIRVFGLSLLAWRLACFAGVPLCLFACWELVKLAGGDRWGQLTTALIIALGGSLGAQLPGRWDAVTSGLFLTGLLLFLRGSEPAGKRLLVRSAAAGVFIGLALASTPRALTLSVSAVVGLVLAGLSFRRFRKAAFLGSLVMLSTALMVHTVLLVPWGETSISWYSYVKRATSGDGLNATLLAGRAAWNLQLHHHKIVAAFFVLLVALSTLGAITQRSRADDGKMPLKSFLTIFALLNLALMLLLLANPLSQSAFWLPPATVAAMCWLNFESLGKEGGAIIAVTLVGACLLMFCLEEAEQGAAVVLTWNRRSTAALTAFVERTIPAGATVYGPIGGYFYPVELSGHQYLYPYERTTPGLYSKIHKSDGDELDGVICSHRTYAMWPKLDPIHHPQEQPMPTALRERVQAPVAEFDQPSLPAWKETLLQRLGRIGGKYGFPDVVIYTLKSPNCSGG